jgi:hypothetical protein
MAIEREETEEWLLLESWFARANLRKDTDVQ